MNSFPDASPSSSRAAAALPLDDVSAVLDKPIAELMQRCVLVIQMDDTLAEVERALLARGLSWAPVVDHGDTVLGVLCEADLMVAAAAGHPPELTRAWQMCTYRPVSVTPDTPCRSVARSMVERRIHHVVVVDDGELVGVASSMDFLRLICSLAR